MMLSILGFAAPHPPLTNTCYKRAALIPPFRRQPACTLLAKIYTPKKKMVSTISQSAVPSDAHGCSCTDDDDVKEARKQLLAASDLKPELMPKHVAIFPDGHRRWAKEKDLPVELGYGAGRRPLKDIAMLCCNLGIKVLSVYAFSNGNWRRPKDEVVFAMNILESALKSDLEMIKREGIRLSVIGNKAALPKQLLDLVIEAEEATKDNTRLQLLAAIDYTGRSDIVQACKSLSKKVENGLIQPEDINDDLFQQHLQTNCSEYPNPDLFIRTSGKYRLGNFMLWQLAYTELMFVEKYAPDFGEPDFMQALRAYQNRSRRFGGHIYSGERLPEEP